VNEQTNRNRSGDMIVAIIFTVLSFFMPVFPVVSYYSGPQSSSEMYSIWKLEDEVRSIKDYYGNYKDHAISELREAASNLGMIYLLMYGFLIAGIILLCVSFAHFLKRDRAGFWNWASWSLSMSFGVWIVIWFYMHSFEDNILRSTVMRTYPGGSRSRLEPSVLFYGIAIAIIVLYFIERSLCKVANQEIKSFEEQEPVFENLKRNELQTGEGSARVNVLPVAVPQSEPDQLMGSGIEQLDNKYPNKKRTAVMIAATIVTILGFWMLSFPVVSYQKAQSESTLYSINAFHINYVKTTKDLVAKDIIEHTNKASAVEENSLICVFLHSGMLILDGIAVILFIISSYKYIKHDEIGFLDWASCSMGILFGVWVLIYIHLQISVQEMNSLLRRTRSYGEFVPSFEIHPLLYILIICIILAFVAEKILARILKKKYKLAGGQQAVGAVEKQTRLDKGTENSLSDSGSADKQESMPDTPSNIKYCIFCGSQIPSEAHFCSHCGKKQKI